MLCAKFTCLKKPYGHPSKMRMAGQADSSEEQDNAPRLVRGIIFPHNLCNDSNCGLLVHDGFVCS